MGIVQAMKRIRVKLLIEAESGTPEDWAEWIANRAKEYHGVKVIETSAREIKPQGREPIPDAKRNYILALRRRGLKYEFIAKEAKVGRMTVIRVCREAGVEKGSL